jgi:hypothetical protein
MLYEWRVYKVVPGKMGALNDRFQRITLRLFEKHGIKVVGFWETVIGVTNVLYYMLAWEAWLTGRKSGIHFSLIPNGSKHDRKPRKTALWLRES